MRLFPGYGETPVPDDELTALIPAARAILGEPITKAAVYDLEQAVGREVGEQPVNAVVERQLGLNVLLTDHFVRELHNRLYEDIWTWAGQFRKLELNIGVAPEQIAVELRASIDAIRYRWEHTTDLTPRQLGIAIHAETVRVHPLTDGNGRMSRLLADLVFVAAQTSDHLEMYDWQLDKRRYISLLREYDRHRNPAELAEFIGIQAIES